MVACVMAGRKQYLEVGNGSVGLRCPRPVKNRLRRAKIWVSLFLSYCADLRRPNLHIQQRNSIGSVIRVFGVLTW